MQQYLIYHNNTYKNISIYYDLMEKYMTITHNNNIEKD